MRFDLIICDIDGCLATEDGGAFDLARLGGLAQRNAAAARGEGPPITVCTGRPLPYAEAMCRLLANTHTPCVCENGAWLYHPATNHYERDPAITVADLDAVAGASRLLEERYAAAGVSQYPGKTASVTLYHPDRERLHAIAPEVDALLADHGWPFRVSMTWDYINIDLPQIDKAAGLRRLFATTGIDPQRAMAIGDTDGDLPMAESVGWFGCPANASERLQARADYVSHYEEIEGVLDIFDAAAKDG